jgi:hypothetical protein
MPEFEFDIDLTPEQNIERFFKHLEAGYPALTPLLRSALSTLLPLPDAGLQRNACRRDANQRVMDEVDALSEANR